ncbi:IS3 family transposase [Mucilaginibacter arboris]|uniref:IS3 family transposase n=1 Tax=Mucilaginibacter arboris TaxID=2682090 RepID=UPI001E5D8043|nr:IS3 family transposase [Mucilaginibacter arboris]
MVKVKWSIRLSRQRDSPAKERTAGYAAGARYTKKGCRHLLQERWQIFGFIKNNRTGFTIGKMCKMFKVSRSGYYSWLCSNLSLRDNDNQNLTGHILKVHADSKGTYGSPRIAMELNRQGIKVSRPRVARLMQKAKIQSIIKNKFIATTDSTHKFAIVENKLERNFKPGTTGAVWVSDITYIKTRQGWLYLTTVLDIGDRKIIGWALSSTMKATETVMPAFKMAQKNRPIINELIFHSDRGCSIPVTNSGIY